MAIEVFNRCEKKYLVNEDMYKKIVDDILPYMDMDKYNKDNQFYTIANIYFDTEDDLLIRQSLEKPIYKEKLRLRGYGVPNMNDKVFLEIKKKYKGIVYKRRTQLKLAESYDYFNYGYIEKKEYMNQQVINEIDYMINRYKLVPKLYLSYDRKAFFCKEDDDFRLTFDTNVRTRRDDLRLEAGSYGEQLLKQGELIMEVKASKGIPLWFVECLSKNNLYPVSISKYGTEYKKYLNRGKEKGGIQLCSHQFLNQQQKGLSQLAAQY